MQAGVHVKPYVNATVGCIEMSMTVHAVVLQLLEVWKDACHLLQLGLQGGSYS